MKKLILLLVVLVAGGVGVTAVTGIGPLADLMPGAAQGKAEDSKETPAAAPPSRDHYYELGGFLVPILDQNGIARQIGVDLTLKVAPDSGNRVSADLPRLQNAITLDLYEFLPRYARGPSEQTRKFVHDRTLNLARNMYGTDAIRDIIVKSIYER